MFDPVNGLHYPYYEVEAYIAKESGGDYSVCTILSTEDEAEAIMAFRSARISKKRPEIMLTLDTGEDRIRLNTKDEFGYDTDYGIA